ncbi:uroporphyrinogen-III C-methyltransferase [Tessaracoccus flavescens]|uniref:uroporphyrinogen-III C-methyltransferase n=1 Tax=Tessaracoccus flavescens TaxID=399497 RepID=A0A1Q2CTS0_9ACTN|nr:uroporphyrinogen-III C-methyltransferase [Tessaracoccus flavescens]AQP49496.1 uroporphyrinogen-III C-methyltransferase [Tessaracoccus flavescens]
MTGRVTLLGGGPGDPDLITVAGLKALQRADVIVYDRLVPLALLDEAREGAELIEVGKVPRGPFTPQERINEILTEKATAGLDVVRFKGGDSFVFGRGGEEWLACQAAGIPVSIIPGVSSSIAAPELAGIPVTHRGVATGFTVVSGHVAPDDERNDVDWAGLATAGNTIVILMGVKNLPEITTALLDAGLDGGTPAAVVADAGLPTMTVLRSTAGAVAEAASQAGIRPPAVCVIGAVAGLGLT